MSCREFIEDLTGKSTRRLPTVDSNTPQQELWYLVYKDETGSTHTVKGTVAAIRRSLKDGLLGDAENVRAARTKAGPFEVLRGYAEFRDMVIEAAPMNVVKPPSASSASSPTDETKPIQQAYKSAAVEPLPPPAVPLIGSRKPHISINNLPPSTSMETLKWVLFFAVFFLTSAIAFWFFQK